MWVIRTAQPWRRVKDPYLRASFRYANPDAHLLGRMWVAKFAHEAYMEMHSLVFKELKVSQLDSFSVHFTNYDSDSMLVPYKLFWFDTRHVDNQR